MSGTLTRTQESPEGGCMCSAAIYTQMEVVYVS
jgi:hypothetical protein